MPAIRKPTGEPSPQHHVSQEDLRSYGSVRTRTQKSRSDNRNGFFNTHSGVTPGVGPSWHRPSRLSIGRRTGTAQAPFSIRSQPLSSGRTRRQIGALVPEGLEQTLPEGQKAGSRPWALNARPRVLNVLAPGFRTLAHPRIIAPAGAFPARPWSRPRGCRSRADPYRLESDGRRSRSP